MSTTIRCRKELTHALKNRGSSGDSYEDVIWDFILMDAINKIDPFVREYHKEHSQIFSTKNRIIQIKSGGHVPEINMPMIHTDEKLNLIYTPQHLMENTVKPMIDKIIVAENKLLDRMTADSIIYMELLLEPLFYTSMNKEYFLTLRTCFNTTATPNLEPVMETTT